MVFSVLLLLYRESLSIKNPTENLARELHRWANEHAAHEHAPRGGGVQRQRADFFSRRSADPHYSREKVGATRHSGVGMWVKAAWRGGGKILGLLASVCFLLISRLPVLHEHLTTTLRSAASAECLEHDSQKAFSFACQGQDVQVRNPPAESTDVTEQGLFIFFQGCSSFNSYLSLFLKLGLIQWNLQSRKTKTQLAFWAFCNTRWSGVSSLFPPIEVLWTAIPKFVQTLKTFFDADDIFLFTCTVSAAEVSQNLYFCGKTTEALRKKNIGIHFWG